MRAARAHSPCFDGRRFEKVAALFDWLRQRPETEKVAVLVRRNAMFDPRLSAEYHRFEIAPSGLKLVSTSD